MVAVIQLLNTSMLVRRVWAGLRKLTNDGRRRRKREIELVRDSTLFQPDWYLQQYPEVAEPAARDPLVDYMTRGWKEGRDPSPDFGTAAYLSANADVARSGANPLVHFIEFGQFEGRGSLASLRKLVRPVRSLDFADPAVCATFPLPETHATVWLRGGDLDGRRADLLKVDGCGVGYLANSEGRAEFEMVAELFRTLSGYGDPTRVRSAGEAVQATVRLTDAWYVNVSQLNTRWEAESFPFVLRAFQLDPSRDGVPLHVGEALIASALDVVELHLRNGLFPLLFVFAAPDGTFRGTHMLAFPSLSRGGVHYPELLYLASHRDGGATIDPVRLSLEHASHLMALLRGEVDPAISNILVELDGSEGAGGLFRPDIKLWLESVVRVPVVGTAERPADKILTKFIAVTPARSRPAEGATLVIGSDAIPTIAALTAAREETEGGTDPVTAALLFDQLDVSQPVFCIEPPSNFASIKASDASRQTWPRVRSNGHGRPGRISFPAAIARSTWRGLDDAQLFVPISRDMATTRDRDGITWLIEPRLWDRRFLSVAIRAAGLQKGANADALAFIGPGDADIEAVASEGFADRFETFGDVRSAVAASRSPLIGYLGKGVILHDNDVATVFSDLLNDPDVATASCVLISSEKRGKRWHAWIADGGVFRSPMRPLARSEVGFAAQQLWRSNYPVEAPPSDLWVARTGQLAAWIDGSQVLGSGEGLHICTSLVTASRFGQAGSEPLTAVVPPAADDRVTRVEAFFG